MYEVRSFWDPYLNRDIKWSTWMNGRAEVIPVYVDKFKAWRPTQQRPRDGTIVRHKRGGLKNVS